jgi:hypothetical protein
MNISLRNLLFLGQLFLLFGTGCGGQTTDVTGEQTPALLQAHFQARIFSSVPQGVGTKSCPTTCESSYTVGSEGSVRSHQDFPTLNFKCDSNGVPETGQGFEATFMVDSQDAQNQQEGTLEASCGPVGATIIDQVTLSIFSASLDVNMGSCGTQSLCELPQLEMSSLNDRINQSGLPALLSGLKCPTLDFLLSLCVGTPSDNSEEVSLGLTCSVVLAAKLGLGCEFHGCGDNQTGEGEECDGTEVSNCAPGEVCNKHCQCITTVCGNGTCEVGRDQSCPTDCLAPPRRRHRPSDLAWKNRCQ